MNEPVSKLPIVVIFELLLWIHPRGENPPNTPGVDYPRFTPSYHWGVQNLPCHSELDSESWQIPGRDSHAASRGAWNDI